MTITIDTESGFCFGVTSAIHKAEEELRKGSLNCLGDIVHNGQEVERLEHLGLRTITYDDLHSLHNTRILLRAHGEPPSTYQTATQNHNTIIDATCPVVKRLQERIRTTYRNHPQAQIVIFGKVGHAEVVGLQGQTDGSAIVVENIKDIDQVNLHRDIYLYSQTTMSVEKFHELANMLQDRMKAASSTAQLSCYDTICRNVANRVDKLQKFAKSQDIVIFVGGKKSSNAKVLCQHCQQANANTIFVSNEDELTAEIISRCHQADRVGICGATSTPLWLMERIKEKIN